jgi:hypothetical protein
MGAPKRAFPRALADLYSFLEGPPDRRRQPAPAAKAATTTLTAAELLTGLITSNPGGAAAATYTTPTGTQVETAMKALRGTWDVDDSFIFSVVNISTNAAETTTIAAGAGVTLVGDNTLSANIPGDTSSGIFLVRKTALNALTIYRLA